MHIVGHNEFIGYIETKLNCVDGNFVEMEENCIMHSKQKDLQIVTTRQLHTGVHIIQCEAYLTICLI